MEGRRIRDETGGYGFRNTITSACMPYELQSQITELNKVVAATNAAYRDSDRAGDAARQDVELRDLKATLNLRIG